METTVDISACDEEVSNIVPIVDGRPITCSTLELFVQTLGTQFQKHVDEFGCEPTILYTALTTPEGPIQACIDIAQDMSEMRHSAAETKIYFHLMYQLAAYPHKI